MDKCNKGGEGGRTSVITSVNRLKRNTEMISKEAKFGGGRRSRNFLIPLRIEAVFVPPPTWFPSLLKERFFQPELKFLLRIFENEMAIRVAGKSRKYFLFSTRSRQSFLEMEKYAPEYEYVFSSWVRRSGLKISGTISRVEGH